RLPLEAQDASYLAASARMESFRRSSIAFPASGSADATRTEAEQLSKRLKWRWERAAAGGGGKDGVRSARKKSRGLKKEGGNLLRGVPATEEKLITMRGDV